MNAAPPDAGTLFTLVNLDHTSGTTGFPGPAELAGTALFLATDDARHMTGGYLVADGGYNMVGA